MNAFEGMQCPDCIPGHLSLIGVDPDIDEAYISLESLDPNWRSVINTRRAIAMKLQPMLPGDWSCTN